MNKRLLILLGIILSGLLAGVIWVLSLPGTSAQYTIGKEAMPLVPRSQEKNERFEAFADCLPDQLTLKNKDRSDRFARAMAEMKNDQIERTLDIKDDYKLSEAEIEFENCLEAKGITPQRILQGGAN
ncbi:MAG: hypothetical protein ACFB4I_07480 [Cyanophyceae cyanobacterium]